VSLAFLLATVAFLLFPLLKLARQRFFPKAASNNGKGTPR
jgi:hypothetical protein